MRRLILEGSDEVIVAMSQEEADFIANWLNSKTTWDEAEDMKEGGREIISQFFFRTSTIRRENYEHEGRVVTAGASAEGLAFGESSMSQGPARIVGYEQVAVILEPEHVEPLVKATSTLSATVPGVPVLYDALRKLKAGLPVPLLFASPKDMPSGGQVDDDDIEFAWA